MAMANAKSVYAASGRLQSGNHLMAGLHGAAKWLVATIIALAPAAFFLPSAEARAEGFRADMAVEARERDASASRASRAAPVSNLADSIEEPPAMPEANKGAVKLPTLAGATVSLFGSDNPQIISVDGAFHRPLVPVSMNVMYQVRAGGLTHNATKDVTFAVSGKYPDRGANPAPDVLPAIREWHGAAGAFALKNSAKIIASPAGSPQAISAAEKTAGFFESMLRVQIPASAGKAASGDIEFIYDPALLPELGSEGYYLAIGDKITIRAAAERALMYGGITVTQAFYSSKDKRAAPKGEARDYPKYPVRAGMLDVGRTYIPLAQLEEIGLFMAWFKLNELHIHLNDYWAASGYSAFRLESERHPELNSLNTGGLGDGCYKKAEYRDFQKKLLKYGVEVINEIDTPAHSQIFGRLPKGGPPMLPSNNAQMDISTQESRAKALAFVIGLIEEYALGEDPVFVGKKIHYGSDEYSSGYDPQLAAYSNDIMEALLARGLEVRLWSSKASVRPELLNKNAANPKVSINAWAGYDQAVAPLYEKGYSVINTTGGWLYAVPGCYSGYPDHWGASYPDGRGAADYTFPYMYDVFSVNNFKPTRSPENGTAIMPLAHPQTKGAQFAVWNDFASFNGGFSEFDIFARMKDPIVFVAEKTWHGEKGPEQTYENYRARANIHWNRAPNANPGRYVESRADLVASYDFSNINAPWTDLSGNGYHAQANGWAAAPAGLSLPSGATLSLPFKSVGYPYTISLKAKLSGVPPNTVLFAGADGTLYANFKGTGRIGFVRGQYGLEYEFEFLDANPHIQQNRWFSLSLACGGQEDVDINGENSKGLVHKDTALYIDGAKRAGRATCVWINNGKKFIAPAPINQGQRHSRGIAYDSNTFVLPVESILPEADAILDRLMIYNRNLASAEIKALHESGFVVELDLGDGTAAKATRAVLGQKIMPPPHPKKEGRMFIGWFKEPGLTTPWDFSEDAITGDVTLYAGWRRSAQ